MHEDIKYLVDQIQLQEPKTYTALYPRRIVPPGGYVNPRLNVLALRGELEECLHAEYNMLAHVTGILNVYSQLSMGVPTFFVRSEFAQAVAQTKPPQDFLFSEIKWPLPAMLFCLPTEFSLRTFGYHVPFISICRVASGQYPADLKLPELTQPKWSLGSICSTVDRLLIVSPVYRDNGLPITYTGAFNLTQNIKDLEAPPFEDATYYEEKLNPGAFLHYDKSGLPTPEDETVFHNKVLNFAVKLLLAITARPDVVQHGNCARKAKLDSKKQRVVDELWNPSTIGWDYRAKRSSAADKGGTHASPRFHWRLGHWHTVLSGPMKDKESQRRLESSERKRSLDWFEPILVNL